MRKIIILFIYILFYFKTSAQLSENGKLNNFIENWLGIPYKLGGKTKGGIDCSKLTQKVYDEVFNYSIPGVSWEQWKFSDRVSKDSLKTGDLVFFSSKYSPSGWHVGLYLDDGYFFHSSGKNKGVCVSHLSEEYYIKNYRGAGRIIR